MKLGRLFAKVREGSFTALESCPHHRLLVVTNWPGLAGPVQCEGCSPQLLFAKLQSPCPHQARGGRLQPPALLPQPSHRKNGGNCSTEQTLSVNRQAFKKSFRNLDIFFLIYQRTDHTLRRWWRFAVSAEEDGLNPATGVWGEDAPASDSCHCYLRWGCSCIWLLLEVTMHSALL